MKADETQHTLHPGTQKTLTCRAHTQTLRPNAPMLSMPPDVPEGEVMVPDDEVVALSGSDVVRTVALSPEVNNTSAHLVLVRCLEQSVVRVAHFATKFEARSREVAPQTHIERHVAIVGVHVEPEIFVRSILDDEGVVRVQGRALLGE
eukprot:CAMPEP_0175821342 /NCGR_PEP_ID=MMETSP0107_2-20121207/9088_1 /TAXON_ID=195067 ORGANISM="Goniomonas pacifica, Strain CCMP1869" /NCGR_SAMPLE_ID=MMETSP0107_2 /ASSEMBLY_ACC=CAM_ASM_000203 /LENGTH=147 /DNA_ID=CAMNT_0017133723 /DNA_START=318 /DNA_END=761 /DNA_ORIENTATION=-